MAATVQGSIEQVQGLTGPLPLQLWKTTVTIATGATTASIKTSNKASGTVVAVWIDPSTLTASATIKGYMVVDGLTTPTYFLDYTVPNPAIETRAALSARLRVFGQLQIDVASATAADSFTVYVWVDPEADTSDALPTGAATETTLAAVESAVDGLEAYLAAVKTAVEIIDDLTAAAIAAAIEDLIIDADNITLSAPADGTYIGDIKFGESLPAGTAIIGTVGIDQTTPGDTNGVQAANPLATVAATIADDASLSGAVDLGAGRVLVAIEMPADWTAADLTFQVCSTSGGTYQDLYDQNGTEKNFKVAADRFVGLDDGSFWLGVRYLKVRSGTAASAVAQDRAAGTVINLITKPV